MFMYFGSSKIPAFFIALLLCLEEAQEDFSL